MKVIGYVFKPTLKPFRQKKMTLLFIHTKKPYGDYVKVQITEVKK